MEVRVGISEGETKNPERDFRSSWLGGDDYLKGGKRKKESEGLILKEMVVSVSYSAKRVESEANPKIELKVLGDEIEDKVLGLLVGIKGEKGVKHIAFLREGGKPTRVAYLVSAELEDEKVDTGVLSGELKKILQSKYSEIEGEGYPLAGAFIGGTEGGKLAIIPFSTYKAKEVIPAFSGEESEEIEKLEAELEELNSLLATEKDEKKVEEIRQRRREVLSALAKEKAKLYRPDLLRAVVQKTINGEEIWLINRKTEIRSMGENLLEGARLAREIGADRGVFVFIAFPAVNNLSNELMTSVLTLALAVGNEFGTEVLDTYKARDYLRKLARGVRDIVEAVEAGAKPPSFVEEENLSLRKRLSDIAKFLTAKPEAVEEVKKGLEELEKGIRLLYSPFSVKDLYTRTDAIRDLTDRGIDIRSFTAEDWKELSELLAEVNERLENELRGLEGYQRLFNAFHKILKEGRGIKIKVRENGEVKEVYYPKENPTIWDWTLTSRFTGIVEKASQKVGIDLKGVKAGYVFKETEVELSESAVKRALARLLLKDMVKSYIEEMETAIPMEVLTLEKLLRDRWRGETVSGGSRRAEIEDVELEAEEDFDDLEKALFGEEGGKEEDIDDLDLLL